MTDTNIIRSGHAYYNLMQGGPEDISLGVAILYDEENLVFERYRHAKRLLRKIQNVIHGRHWKGLDSVTKDKVWTIQERLIQDKYKLTTHKEDEHKAS